MTTLSPTMASLLADLAKVTKARRDNWSGGEAPKDAALEAKHLLDMRQIKRAIEEEENTKDREREASAASDCSDQ